MPLYIDTRGLTNVAIAICDRCRLKMPRVRLEEDPNAPGVLVCSQCKDKYDPWRLPARKTEDITIHHPQPDEDLEV